MTRLEELEEQRKAIAAEVAELKRADPPPWAKFVMSKLPPSEIDGEYGQPRLLGNGELVWGAKHHICTTVRANDEGVQVLEALIALIRWYQAGEPVDD